MDPGGQSLLLQDELDGEVEKKSKARAGKHKPRRGAICEVPDCNSRASFGDDLKKYRWCAKHRLPGSKCFQSTFCEHDGCHKYASYSLGGGRKQWCAAHRPEGAMIKGAMKCQVEGCRKQPTFGFPGQKRQWCTAHKMPGAVNLSKRSCSEMGCSSRAIMLHSVTGRRFCTEHAPDGCERLPTRSAKRSVDELVEQLNYVEEQNNKLRQENKELRSMIDPRRLKDFDRDLRIMPQGKRGLGPLSPHGLSPSNKRQMTAHCSQDDLTPLSGQPLAPLATLEGHQDRAWHVAWSPCGNVLASCGADKIVRIWALADKEDQASWTCVSTLEDVQSRTIRSCEFSPCGSYLAAASFDSTTVIWQRGTRDGSVGLSWECVATLEGHENEVKSVAWSADGSFIATCSRDKSVWIFEAPKPTTPAAALPDEEIECECVSVLSGHSQDVKSVKWHPTEPLLFSASYDDTVRVWSEQVDDWACQQVLEGHTNTVWGLALHPSGTSLATCSQDCTVRLWERDAEKQYKTLAVLEGRHERTIFSIDWSPDGALIATAGGDDAVVVQAAAGGAVTNTVAGAHASDVNCVRWNPKRTGVFATAGDDGLVKVWLLPR